MKSIEQVGAYRQARVPHAKAPTSVRRSPALAMELRVLRLAADAVEIKKDIASHDLANCPYVAAALKACEALFESMGWGDQTVLEED
jgi:hypothetical protein